MGNNDRTTGVLAEDSSDKPENKYLLYLSVIILKGKDFYKKSGFVRALILFTGVIGFLQTWYSLIKFMIFQDHTKFDYEQLFVFGRQLFWIFGFMVLIYIGTAKHKIFRQYCIDAFSFIFNAIFVLSFATSIFIVMSIPDFVISNKEGELRFSIGPASIFAILLYLANYLAVGYFNRKVITRNNLSLFAPIFIQFIAVCPSHLSHFSVRTIFCFKMLTTYGIIRINSKMERIWEPSKFHEKTERWRQMRLEYSSALKYE